MRVRLLPAILAAIAAAVPTSDLEAQWQILESHTTADLRGIHSVGNGIAWASGTAGTVLRTTDDGATWQRCPTPPSAEHLDFRGIQAFDATTAIVMSSGKGDLSRLYKTTDGCKSWKLVFTNPDADGFWDAVQFDQREPYSPTTESPQRGVLIGDPVSSTFVIYETSDAGESWQRWENSSGAPPAVRGVFPAKAALGESLFAASNTALIAPGVNGPFAFVTGGKGGARLFVPEAHSPFDNGTTWKFYRTKLPIKSAGSSGAFSLASRAAGNFNADLMIVGGDYGTPDTVGTAVFVPASNRCCFGLLPQKLLVPQTPPHGYRSAVAYDKPTNTWITVGPNGTDISTDDGRNWRALKPAPTDPPDADRDWNALSLPFVVGPHGRIGRLRPEALPSQ